MRNLRSRRTWIYISFMALIGTLFWYFVIRPADADYPLVRPVKVAVTGNVTIGTNLHVNQAAKDRSCFECGITADPKNPLLLFASSCYFDEPTKTGLQGYLSTDGGETWKESLLLRPDHDKVHRYCDQTAAFGPDGTLHLVHISMVLESATDSSKPPKSDIHWRSLAKSDPATWQLESVVGSERDRMLDRPWLAVEHRAGRHQGTLYCSANDGPPKMMVSKDQGKTHQSPKLGLGPEWSAQGPTQPVILRDGTVLVAYRCMYHKQFNTVPMTTFVFRSQDGGTSFERVSTISEAWRQPDRHLDHAYWQEGFFPQLAVDSSNLFPDRLYYVWVQGAHQGQRGSRMKSYTLILFSRSADGARRGRFRNC